MNLNPQGFASQVSQLNNVIAKKDAEIANLHSICDRAEKGDNSIGAGKVKPKPTNATRRVSTDPSAAAPQKSRRGNNADNGGKTVEVCLSSESQKCFLPVFYL